jgi:hypothetical protein
VHELTLEVFALRNLYYFRFTREQLLLLQKLARETAAPERQRETAQASEDYVRVLGELRTALIAASDADRIDDLEERLSELQTSESPVVDDTFEITPKARQRVLEVFRGLKPNQLASYYALLTDDVADPADDLVSNLEALRDAPDAEWKETRDNLALELAWHVAGLDERKSAKIVKGVLDLLNEARALKDAEFAAKKPVLERRARKLIGEVDPAEVLRNHTLYVLADLLSNPRLAAAIEARLKPEK